ncbi:MAG TPA: glycosyltransferase [Methanocella sp.]|nr:glycosyltransferase [Methanocella sp.]
MKQVQQEVAAAGEKGLLVSIIVSIYSSKRYDDLVDLIDGVRGQTYGHNEMIIVVDENVDLYNKITEHLAAHDYRNVFPVFNPDNRGLSYSRNLGVDLAKGDVVAFIDDDAVPEPQWIEAIAQCFVKCVGAVAGHVAPKWESNSMVWFPRELFWMISCTYQNNLETKAEIERGFGVNMAFRRDLLTRMGGFNEKLGINGKKWLGGEDTDMFLKVREAGWKVIYSPDAKVAHKIFRDRLCLKKIVKRAFDGGKSIAALKKYRRYAIKNSTEQNYLKTILFEYYPATLRRFLTFCAHTIKQVVAVSATVLFVGIGYIYGFFS